MKFIQSFLLLSLVFTLSLWSATLVPYSGKIDIRGVNYFGEAQFAFSLHDGNGTTHWRNGNQPKETIKVTIRNGRYSVLLGGQGMNSLPPELFLTHDKLYLKVEFDNEDGEGLRHLAPDQLITATPRALVADIAKVSELARVAQVAQKVGNGAITREMLSQEVLSQLDANESSASVGPITRDMLPASVLNDLNKTIVITRDMLPQDVQDDLNQSVVITRDMLPQDVQDDLNKTIIITRSMLPADVLAVLNHSISAGSISLNMLAPEVRNDLNRTITKSMLGSDVLADLNQSITTVSRDMLPASVLADLNRTITKSMLGNDVLADLNKTITRDMLPQDVRDDLNKTITITRNMLPADVLSDLNRTISKSMLGSDVLADLNKSSTTASPITLSMLAPEVTAKLDQNGSGGGGVVAGSIISFPSGQAAPDGYSLYQQGTPKELVWEEKAPVSVPRFAYDGVEVLDGKIYFVGGKDGSSAKNIAERYDPTNNTWETLNSMSVARQGVASAVLNGKLYAIGGQGVASVEVYDPSTESWSSGVALPSEVNHGTAITVGVKIYLIGGRNSSDQDINQVLSFDPSVSQWTAKANMPTARHGMKLVWFDNQIWAIGGYSSSTYSSKVESYDPNTNSWQTEASLTTARQYPVVWVANGRIYVGGGKKDSSLYLNSIEVYDQVNKSWSNAGNFPENKFAADAVVLNNKAYVIAGRRDANNYSNKVFAADLNASVVGVYDLYRKDGNASAGTPLVQAEVADGSVTASKIASKTIGKDQISDDILKYLKPEITAQPIGRVVYADSNVSLSVTAEGKYLTYQWKKDGSHLTGENNSTMTITDSNATLHDGNYSVVVSNDFGSVESGEILVDVNTTWSTDGLVGWWKFDETNGTVAYDSSGNGNDGNLTGGPTWATGRIGGALSFDGVDDYVIMPATTDLDLMKLSISTWVYSTNFDQNGFIFEKTADGNLNSQYNLFIQNSELRFRVKPINSGYSDTKVDQSILSGWSFITSSYNSSKRKLFVNGQLVASNDFNETIATNPNGISLIGAYALNSIGNNYFFNGLIDDVRIYDRALSAAEVQALYNMGQ